MKILCSATSCKYSSENEDSSHIVFISFPNNDTASLWAHNCRRPDLFGKCFQELHANHYICSDHIEERFFISKANPVVIAQGAVPTLFENVQNSMKEDYHTEGAIDSLQLSECMNNVDRACHERDLSMEDGTDYRKSYSGEDETDTANSLNFCDVTESIEHLQEISVRSTSLCRMCGQLVTDGIEIFAPKGLELSLKEKIGLHTSINVEPHDLLPRYICSDCCEKLEAAHSLIVTCLRTDMRLRRYFNISDKPEYDPKFDRLVAECSLEMANEISLENVVDTSDLSSNEKKIDKLVDTNKFNCKWKDTVSGIELEQVQICPITDTSTENMSGFKYVVHADLNNLLHVFRGIGQKNDDVSNELSMPIVQTAQIVETSRFVCANCNVGFETRDMYDSHRMICTTEVEVQSSKATIELDTSIVCSICKLAFVNTEYLENHQCSCNDNNVTQYNCKNCDKSFSNKNDFDNHELLHTEKNYSNSMNRRCGYCFAVFDNRKDLQCHIVDNHDGLQPLYRCSICDKTYEKWSSLDVHEATHRADKPYLCDLCGKSFKHSNNLRGHKRIHLDEAKKKRHVCDVCGNAFRSRFHLREHMNQHNGDKPYACEVCEKAFYKRIQLRQHRLSHGTNKYACPICGVTFNRRGNMKTHFKRHDKSGGMYTCSVCKYKCKSMSELKMHRKQHTETDIMESIKLKTADKRVWQCKICDKVFPKRAILSNHERTHTGEQMKVECDKCGKKLASKSSLKYHNRSIHSTERPHMCQFCGEAFVSKEARLIHERIHTGERPYACKICNMQYRCSSNLSQHMKIHSAMRPHVCRYCNKTFTRKGALSVHERIHTGLKPFGCEICHRSFSQKNDMLKHTKTHQAKSMQCEKCDEIFETKSEITKHLDVHKQNIVDDSVMPSYNAITEPLESYTLSLQCSSIRECDEMQNVQNK